MLTCRIYLHPDYSAAHTQASLASDAARIVESDSFTSTCRTVFTRHLHTLHSKQASSTSSTPPPLQHVASADGLLPTHQRRKSQVKVQRPLRLQLSLHGTPASHSTHTSLIDDDFELAKQHSFSTSTSTSHTIHSVHEIKVASPPHGATNMEGQEQTVSTAEVSQHDGGPCAIGCVQAVICLLCMSCC